MTRKELMFDLLFFVAVWNRSKWPVNGQKKNDQKQKKVHKLKLEMWI